MICPVTSSDPSINAKIASATSSGPQTFPSTAFVSQYFFVGSYAAPNPCFNHSPSMNAGATAFTLTFGASTLANESVRLFNAAFDAQYGMLLPIALKPAIDETLTTLP